MPDTSREVVDFESVTAEQLADLTFVSPARLVLPNPLRGGPRLAGVRQALSPKGRVRISATAARTFVDIDPGEPAPPLIALDTIVRSDAAGLERMLFSVLPHVDEVVLGVDGRSDEETLKVAMAYADCAFVFTGDDIGLDRSTWEPSEANPRGKIDFAAARNLGRAKVRSPWALVVDSDEFMGVTEDLRARVRGATSNVDSFTIRVQMGGFEHRDPQRLVRTQYRWTCATHNQILYPNPPLDAESVIVHDLSLRAAAEQEQRLAQRNLGMNDLIEEAEKGNIVALFHLAKHRTAGDVNDAVKLAERYRSLIEPHSPLADERVWIALAVAFRFYNEDNLVEAERWAVRALLDGPSLTAFCLLGDIAEGQGDLVRARGWYECACALTEKRRIEWPGYTELRSGRLSGIQTALTNPEQATKVEVVDDDAPATVAAPESDTRTSSV